MFGFHALLVIFGYFELHLPQYNGFWYDVHQVSTTYLLLNLNPIGLGHNGVELFLVISGFLIHWGYLKGGSHFVAFKFYNKRFWRIYPPYLATLLFFVLTLGTGGTFSLLTHLTLTHNLFNSTFYTINASYWSLALEMQLYVLYPLYLVLHKRLGLNKSVSLVALVAVLYIIFELVTGIENSTSIFKMWLIWILGAYLGENFFYQRRIYSGKFIYLVFAYIVYIALRATIISVYAGDILFSLLTICAIDWYLHTDIKFPVVSKHVANILSLIGLYSYSIYLIHQPFLKHMIGFFSRNFASGLWSLLGACLSFIVVFAISFCTYHCLELTSIKLGTKILKKFSNN